MPPGWNRVRELGYSSIVVIEQGIQQKVFPLSYQYLPLSFAISTASYQLCCSIPPHLDRLLVAQTAFERVVGFVTKQDPFWHSESVDCVNYTDPSFCIHSTTTREGSKSVNRLETG